MVSNTGYWHKKANSVGMQQLAHPSTNKPLLTLNCSPNASKECPEIPGQQDPTAPPPEFAPGDYTTSEEKFYISVFPEWPWVLTLSLITQVLFFCSPSFFSQINSPTLMIIVGSGWIKDLPHLIQWHKYGTFIIYSTCRSAKDKFTCDTCKINSYLFLIDFH